MIAGFFDAIATTFDDLVTAVDDAWTTVKTTTETIWNGVKAFLTDWWRVILVTLTGPIGAVAVLVIDHWDEIKTATETIFRAIANLLTAIWGEIYTQVIQTKLDAIKTFVGDAWEAIRLATETIFRAIANLLTAIWGEIYTHVIQPKVDAIKLYLSDTWEAITAGDRREDAGRLDAGLDHLGGRQDVDRDGPERRADVRPRYHLRADAGRRGREDQRGEDGRRDRDHRAQDGRRERAEPVPRLVARHDLGADLGGGRREDGRREDGVRGCPERVQDDGRYRDGRRPRRLGDDVGRDRAAAVVAEGRARRVEEARSRTSSRRHAEVADPALADAVPGRARGRDGCGQGDGAALDHARRRRLRGQRRDRRLHPQGGIEARGIDPDVAIRIAQHEGGTEEYNKRGTFKTGSSWWPFQLHYGGAGTPYAYLGTTAGMGNDFTREDRLAARRPEGLEGLDRLGAQRRREARLERSGTDAGPPASAPGRASPGTRRRLGRASTARSWPGSASAAPSTSSRTARSAAAGAAGDLQSVTMPIVIGTA
jgi:hypothetical protein